MKSVLISIHPKWCSLISSKEKTVELRKTMPKLNAPFRCYIYCTMPKTKDPKEVLEIHGVDGKIRRANGKVIGEFVCDIIIKDKTFGHDELLNAAACISGVEAEAYSMGSPMYGWFISNLFIYDQPKELSEFNLKRSPQSWCYVEELK